MVPDGTKLDTIVVRAPAPQASNKNGGLLYVSVGQINEIQEKDHTGKF